MTAPEERVEIFFFSFFHDQTSISASAATDFWNTDEACGKWMDRAVKHDERVATVVGDSAADL